MLARITNYSYRMIFPTCLGNIHLPTRKTIELSNPQAIKEFGDFKDVVVKVIEEEEKIDYSPFPIQQLRRIATQVGIKSSFFMKKEEIIKNLEEKNAI